MPDAGGPAPGARIAAFWRGHHHRAVVRVTLAFLAGTALLLTSAGACESGPADPGSTQTGY